MTFTRRSLIVPTLAATALLLSGCGLPGAGGGPAGDPVSVVEAYFAALADGDAEAAKELLDIPASDAKYLTQEMLDASQQLAPIADVEVGEPTGDSEYSQEVPVSFTLGGKSVTTEIHVYDGNDGWFVSGGLGVVRVAQWDGLGLTLNGIPVEGTDGQVSVFPGAYELAVSEPNFELRGDTIVYPVEPYRPVDVSAVEAGLSDDALALFRDLVRSAVAECVASTTLAAGCGLELPDTLSDGTVLTDGTIVRTLSADASATIDSMVPTLSYDNPTLAEGEFIGGVSMTATCTQGGSSGTCSILFGPSLGRPVVDMGATSPVVVWE
jgi:hypothetical protein